jgi:predicted dehydrogenase
MNPAIGIIGAGTIVRHGHLPAYRQLGLDVRGIYDRDPQQARQTADAFPGLDVCPSIDAMLADPAVQIIDIAITPQDQLDTARRALDAGKHLLCQKPLAPTLEEAKRLVAYAEARNLLLAVNQQMRWEPIVASVKAALDRGDLGEPVAGLIETNMDMGLPPGHWLAREHRFMALYGAIHFLDSARYLFGEPQRVTARLLRHPLQHQDGETWINAWLEWPGGMMLVIFERYTNYAADLTAKMRVEGTRGVIRGRFGIWDRYPQPGPELVEFQSFAPGRPGDWRTLSDDQTWMPGAFGQPMLSLIHAIRTGGVPETSGRDNLKTLRLVEALYRSSDERRPVEPEEVDPLDV